MNNVLLDNLKNNNILHFNSVNKVSTGGGAV